MDRYRIILVALCGLVSVANPNLTAAEPGIGFAEIIGPVYQFRQSDVLQTPWNKNADRGGYGKKLRGSTRRTDFRFKIRAHEDAQFHSMGSKSVERRPWQIKAGQFLPIVNRPLTTVNKFQSSFTVTDLIVDWTTRPTIRVVVAAEPNHSSFRPNQSEHPTALVAYLIQVRPEGVDQDLPPEHWPVWYVNNWIHSSSDVVPTRHAHFLANQGFIFWSPGVFDPPENLVFDPASSVGVYRLLRHPSSGKISSVVLHTPGVCELDDASDEQRRYSKPPVTKAVASTLTGKAPLKIDFTATASDASGEDILWMAWDFDGSDGVGYDATGTRVSHTFTKPGKYVVSLVAMNSSGVPGRDHVRIEVKP